LKCTVETDFSGYIALQMAGKRLSEAELLSHLSRCVLGKKILNLGHSGSPDRIKEPHEFGWRETTTLFSLMFLIEHLEWPMVIAASKPVKNVEGKYF
jgi:hypothetical protein